MSDIEKKESETKNAAASEKADKKSEKSVQKAEKVKKTPLRKRIAKSFREYKSELKKIVWYYLRLVLSGSLELSISA